MLVRPVELTDWPYLAAIYQEGIDTGHATMETKAPPPDEMATKYLIQPQLVAEQDGQVVGYALLSAVSGRCVYGGVAEVSIYIRSDQQGHGIGKNLLEKLILESEKQGLWTLQAGIFPENKASVAIHHRVGFRTVGLREKIGQRNGIWRDVLLLERRSAVVGL